MSDSSHSYPRRVQVKTSLGFDPMLKVLRPNAKGDFKTVSLHLPFLLTRLSLGGQEPFVLDLFKAI